MMKTKLYKEVDFRGHLTHFFRKDYILTIAEAYKKMYGDDFYNKFIEYREMYRKANDERTILPMPQTLILALRDKCNLICPHCFRQHSKFPVSEKSEITFKEFEKIIDEAVEMKIPAVVMGAEAEFFTHPKAMDMIEYVCENQKFLDTILVTNGTLLTKKRIDGILDCALTRLNISVDAFTQETYSKVRGGSLQALLDKIHYFLDEKKRRKCLLPILRITFIKYNLTEKDTEKFIEYWIDKADIVDIQALTDVPLTHELTFEGLDSLSCAYPWNSIYIRWDGSYHACCSSFGLHLPELGNARDTTIKDAWTSNEIKEIRKRIKGDKNTIPLPCSNCWQSLNPERKYEPLNKAALNEAGNQ